MHIYKFKIDEVVPMKILNWKGEKMFYNKILYASYKVGLIICSQAAGKITNKIIGIFFQVLQMYIILRIKDAGHAQVLGRFIFTTLVD